MKRRKKQQQLPVIPLRDMVVFPHARVPFIVGRAASVAAVQAAVEGDRRVFLVMQREADVKEPAPRDLNAVGTTCRVVHDLRLPDGNYKLLVEGIARARVASVVKDRLHLVAAVTPLAAPAAPDPAALEAARTRLARSLSEHQKQQSSGGFEQTLALLAAGSFERAADDLSAKLGASAIEKQELLECVDLVARMDKLQMLLDLEADKSRLDRKLARQVQVQVEQSQREYLLNEKMKAIQKELGRKPDMPDAEALEKRVRDAGMPEEARERALQEVRRLEGMAPVSAEATVARNYLDWMLAVPWRKRTRERRDFDEAARILDQDHHGLENVKERILEFLAVRQLQKGRPRGSILCFVGPPGVGKTSLGKSIARATGRKFVRLSLGGVRDEAEVRGHRRTYVGAYPGRIIQMMRKAGTRNPVFLLDEIDKMSADFRGDPSAALLEVLDPEHNRAFLDHYLDTEFDLSEVMFACTANVLHGIPPALRDRLEVIRLPGYTLREKLAVAQRFLLPKQLEAHGLGPEHLEIADEAIAAIVEHYTREAGVRSLEREIASACRKVATRVVRSPDARVRLASLDDVRALLGVPRFRPTMADTEPQVGVAIGLAWTEQGGQLLVVEATRMGGRGKLMVTGQLGDVMQESMQAALSYVRARSARFGLADDFFRSQDVHVHVPEGAIPKDGPSAGITLATALVSALTGQPVRHDVALTGEITLRGRVLPVGGVKEKVLAAHRSGIRHVVLPRECARDLEDVPAEILSELQVTLVSDMDEVLDVALAPAADAMDPSLGEPPLRPAGHLPDAEIRA